MSHVVKIITYHLFSDLKSLILYIMMMVERGEISSREKNQFVFKGTRADSKKQCYEKYCSCEKACQVLAL